MAASRPARIFRGAYRPEKLRCGLVTDKKSERASPCYLFARKLHSEAVDFYSQLSSEFFLAKQNVTLARKLTEARKHQRRDAASETRRAAVMAALQAAGRSSTGTRWISSVKRRLACVTDGALSSSDPCDKP